MSIRDLYPDATEPTPPRFNVGDLVYTKSTVKMPGYIVDIDDTESIVQLMNAYGYSSDEVIVDPSIFGVVVNYQEPGTVLNRHSSHWLPRLNQPEQEYVWNGVEDPYAESELDLPDSGSIWFLPDNERRYFVKWFNKETYKYGEKPNVFAPMRSNTGNEVFNISLHSEGWMFKAPDFVGKLRKKVADRKAVESVLNDRLNIDECSTKGIASIVCKYK